jgi:hypothetical protein
LSQSGAAAGLHGRRRPRGARLAQGDRPRLRRAPRGGAGGRPRVPDLAVAAACVADARELGPAGALRPGARRGAARGRPVRLHRRGEHGLPARGVRPDRRLRPAPPAPARLGVRRRGPRAPAAHVRDRRQGLVRAVGRDPRRGAAEPSDPGVPPEVAPRPRPGDVAHAACRPRVRSRRLPAARARGAPASRGTALLLPRRPVRGGADARRRRAQGDRAHLLLGERGARGARRHLPARPRRVARRGRGGLGPGAADRARPRRARGGDRGGRGKRR